MTDRAIAEALKEEAAFGAMNDLLCRFYMRWRPDGDYLRCSACRRPQIATCAHLDFPHASDCPRAGSDEKHPWITLTGILQPLANRRAPGGAGDADLIEDMIASLDECRSLAAAWAGYYARNYMGNKGEPYSDWHETHADIIKRADAAIDRANGVSEAAKSPWRSAAEGWPEEAGEYLILMRFEKEGDMVLVGDWWANIWSVTVPGQQPLGFAHPWYWAPIPKLPELPPIGPDDRARGASNRDA